MYTVEAGVTEIQSSSDPFLLIISMAMTSGEKGGGSDITASLVRPLSNSCILFPQVPSLFLIPTLPGTT